MTNEDLKQFCEELLTNEIGEACTVTVTIANKLKVEIGEDFYIFDDEWKVGYVKFRGWYAEVGNTVRKIKKILTANTKRFAQFVITHKNV
jgi:hypothetical protein